MNFDAWVAERTKLVNEALDEACPADGTRLREAMRYSLLAGGKRIRPLLCLAAAEAVGSIVHTHPTSMWIAGSGLVVREDLATPNTSLRTACALEMIHTFSLIHDDLPAMDDDDLRRGLPTCHKKFDEATAILAGNALQAMAFKIIVEEDNAEAVIILASACLRMCQGQSADIEAENKPITLEELQNIHQEKTGRLIGASVLLGGHSAHSFEEPQQLALAGYSRRIGVAFQIVDDILDVTGTDESLGKPANSDLKHDKATYPKLVGLDESRRLAREALGSALGAIEPLGEPAEPLRQIARWIVERNV